MDPCPDPDTLSLSGDLGSDEELDRTAGPIGRRPAVKDGGGVEELPLKYERMPV